MNKAELIELIATQNELSKALSGRVLDSILLAITASVKKGEGTSLIGFGSFKQASRNARTGKNPKTGEPLKIAARKVPRFVPGAAFKASVDPKFATKAAATKTARAAVDKKAPAKKR